MKLFSYFLILVLILSHSISNGGHLVELILRGGTNIALKFVLMLEMFIFVLRLSFLYQGVCILQRIIFYNNFKDNKTR